MAFVLFLLDVTSSIIWQSVPRDQSRTNRVLTRKTGVLAGRSLSLWLNGNLLCLLVEIGAEVGNSSLFLCKGSI